MGDISVAGKTTEEMVHLPYTAGGLLEFLEDSSLAILLNYIVCFDSCDSLLFLSYFAQVAIALPFCLQRRTS